jgi:O-antigen/teichoic acid export membrane protein
MEANAFFLWATALTGAGAGFLFWNLSARFYSSDDVGFASSIISLSLLVSGMTSLGVGVGMVRYLGTARNRPAVINTALTLTLLTSLVFGAVCVWGIRIWSPGLLLLQEFPQGIAFLLLLAEYTHNNLFLMVFLALKRSGASWMMALLLNVVRLGMLIFLRIEGSLGIVISLAIATVVANLLAVAWLGRVEPGYRMRPVLSGAILRAIIPYSFFSGMADFLAKVPAMIAPLLALQYLGATASAHVYIAWMMGSLVLSPGVALAQSTFSENASNPSGIRAAVWRSIRYSLLVTSVIAAVVFLLSSWLLSLFGPDYVGAGVLLRWLCLAAPMYAITIVLMSAFRVQNRLWMLFLVNGLVIALFVGPQVATLQSVGLDGTGVAWVAAQVGALVLGWLAYRRNPERIFQGLEMPTMIAEPQKPES